MPPVTMKDANGTTITVDDADIAVHQARGFTVESGAERAARAQESAKAEAYEGVGSTIRAGVEGALDGATLGAYSAAAGAIGGRAAEGVAERQDRHGVASTLGQVVGAVGGVALGGTPAGLLSRSTEKAAAGVFGKSVAGRAASTALAYGVEGAAEAGANYVAQTILRDREFSSEALMESMKFGGLLGGGLGAAGSLGSSAFKRLAGAAQEGSPAKLLGHLGEMGEADLKAALKEAGEVGAAKVTIPYKKFIAESERTAEKVGARAGEVIAELGEAKGLLASTRKEVSTLFNDARVAIAPDQAAASMARGEVSAALQMYGNAVAAADKWQKTWIKEITPADLAAGKFPQMTDSAAAQAVDVLGAVDDASKALQATMERARAALPAPMPQVPQPQGLLGKIGNAVTAVGAVADMGRSIGLPIPTLSSLPGGGLVDTFIKYRMAKAALGGVGGVAATPQARAAASVVAARNRIGGAVQSVASGKTINLPPVNLGKIAQPQAAAKMIREILAADPASVSAAAAGEAADLGDDLKAGMSEAAARKLAALQEVAPKPPGANTAFAPRDWQPTPTQARRFAAQFYAAERPLEAIGQVMSTGWSPHAADMAAMVKQVAPAIWAEAQARLLENIDQIVAKAPAVARSRLGTLFEIPLTLQQTSDYKAAAALVQQQKPQAQEQPQLGQPGTPTRLTGLMQTESERRILG